MQRRWKLGFGAALVVVLVGLAGSQLAGARTGDRAAAAAATPTCALGNTAGAIQHVIYVQFDNTHFRRDRPDVPSDLEQMPHLLNFIQNNGVLMSNDHTVLISHSATAILTSLTGVYPDRMGQPVSHSFRYFTGADARM